MTETPKGSTTRKSYIEKKIIIKRNFRIRVTSFIVSFLLSLFFLCIIIGDMPRDKLTTRSKQMAPPWKVQKFYGEGGSIA